MVLVPGSWQSLALRGLAALLFGILALVWPDLTLWALVILFGAYVLVDGLFALAAAFRGEGRDRRGWLAVEGVAGVLAGIITFVWPDITALALLFLIAAWALVTGVMKIAMAIQLRHEISNEWMLWLSGLVSIAFAVVLVITPGAGALVITWLIGWFAVVLAIVLFVVAWRLRRIETDIRSMRPVGPATT
jgi:uncharacterized membrane protein HdeD (DUF308 family)